MATVNHWNVFQQKNKGKYTSDEMRKHYEVYKKKHNIVRSPKKSTRLEGFQAKHKKLASPQKLKSMYAQQQTCKELRKKLSPNRYNECQKKNQGKYTKAQLQKKMCVNNIKYNNTLLYFFLIK